MKADSNQPDKLTQPKGRSKSDSGLYGAMPKIRELYEQSENRQYGIDYRFRAGQDWAETIKKARTKTSFEQKPHVHTPPGSRLFSIADFLYSPKDVEEVFGQIIKDWRDEYYKALNEKRMWKASWINLRYRIRFGQTMGLEKPWAMIKKVVEEALKLIGY